MKQRISVAAIIITLVMALISTTWISGQDKLQRESPNPELMPQQDDLGESVATLVAYTGQITKSQVELPNSNSVVNVVNHTNSSVDTDFIAIDSEGNEVARETVVVRPKLKAKLNLQELFPELVFSDLSTIQVQSSVRPLQSDAIVAKVQLPVAFFSQLDPRWSGNQLGTCRETIGSAGCAISCIAMAGARSVYNFNPATLNAYLTNNNGYANGCYVNWSAPAKIDGQGGFTYIGTGKVKDAANLKSLIDGSKFSIAKSTRFSSGHYAIIIGYDGQGIKLSDFYYLDPADKTAIFRRVGDGFVTASSLTQIYQ